ncbi:putative UTP--glucose-1-phosphate uridylyltransferase [Schizosaccharomyces pombe]|uniref:Probable UTP--glucose-1-phosphate uridylyltransferase n=1 Tax=Schizosaccharomyces pombe (strain 972 / ATCC 24843) TaxID=284812 RepID=UGPA2_SCHPO|nr:putative UTP-glucose-1-phosphate uridylyltransferase [Schizosaccharomyces pombe]O59819.1 RecName: Full=Probable UTP--glucose-1-phosphate uridylyltransferase; AltName: Full=UDP-glucose pyrophosphorylase; Short=UDPGP; Short=UGPase [Schizosaccharomyces pombe 972h-]CAA19137.1 UTP-glucose-1-phosphate uridylyltransferase (predicted) [Schizosaccharomyces pombe]|eukprot:NP_587758.1 putative UTP-glucose-1-phosphate uridylyltransferase [Schizosaccharomyces pombe]
MLHRRIHFKSQSTLDFDSVAVSISASTMKNELDKLVLNSRVSDKKTFGIQMDNFFALYRRYLLHTVKGYECDWDSIRPLGPEDMIDYGDLPLCKNAGKYLNRLAVVKLNGGMGNALGVNYPKAMIEVRDNQSFLDLSIRQIEYLNRRYDVSVPFILMNSYDTNDETCKVLRKYAGCKIDISTFEQSRYPRVFVDSQLPVPKAAPSPIEEWYPPGHGDIFDALVHSGTIERLLAQGKDYLFVSNIDNLGASVDLNILSHVIDNQIEYSMEITDKTKADIKVGILVNQDGLLRLLETNQVPEQHREEFMSDKVFKYINTNNVWLYLPAVKRVVENRELNLDIMPNIETVYYNNEPARIIEFTTAIGSAISQFKKTEGIRVSRPRFISVKNSSDLFLVRCDLYNVDHGSLKIEESRLGFPPPVVRMSNEFKDIAELFCRIPYMPSMKDLVSLSISGNVYFGRNVILKGNIVIVASENTILCIPSNAVLENCVVTGNCKIMEC